MANRITGDTNINMAWHNNKMFFIKRKKFDMIKEREATSYKIVNPMFLHRRIFCETPSCYLPETSMEIILRN